MSDMSSLEFLAGRGSGSNKIKALSPSEMGFLEVWIYFNLVSNTILLPILVATFLFSKTAKRHPTLINVCVTWIFSGIFSCLLFYAGKQYGAQPSQALCIAQTSLLYGITPMWSVAVFMLIFHMSIAFEGNPIKAHLSRSKMYLMLAAPYVTQFVFTLAALILSLQNPREVTRDRKILYCSLKYTPLFLAMAIFTLIVCIGITCLLVQLAMTLFRNWRGLNSAGKSVGVNLPVVLRVMAFGAYVFFGMCITLIDIFDSSTIIPDIYAATIGTVLLLIFGTQADVFRAWCFWRRTPPQLVTPRTAGLDGGKNWYESDKYDQKRPNFDEPDRETEKWPVDDEEGRIGGKEEIRRPPAARSPSRS